jgi:hypothetical protein
MRHAPSHSCTHEKQSKLFGHKITAYYNEEEITQNDDMDVAHDVR